MPTTSKLDIPLFTIQRHSLSLVGELKNAANKVLRSGQFILGEEVCAFEEELAAFCRVRYCVGVASGTDALRLALEALELKPGEEVLTTPFTFFATASVVYHLGLRPVFVDIHERTFNLDPSKIEASISPKTRAIIPVHLFGQCAEMDEILSIAKQHSLAVVEDAAQAIGATYDGQSAGSMSEAGIFSFYPTKNLGACGDAGAVVTNRKEVADRVRLLRQHGMRPAYHHPVAGINSRLDEIQAALLRVQLRHLPRWNQRRVEIAKRYDVGIQNPKLQKPWIHPRATSVYHLYTLRCSMRDPLKNYLQEQGIGAGIYYPTPLHLQPCFQYLGYTKGNFPVSEQLAREVLSIPISPELTEEEVEYVIQKLNEW